MKISNLFCSFQTNSYSLEAFQDKSVSQNQRLNPVKSWKQANTYLDISSTDQNWAKFQPETMRLAVGQHKPEKRIK